MVKTRWRKGLSEDVLNNKLFDDLMLLKLSACCFLFTLVKIKVMQPDTDFITNTPFCNLVNLYVCILYIKEGTKIRKYYLMAHFHPNRNLIELNLFHQVS